MQLLTLILIVIATISILVIFKHLLFKTFTKSTISVLMIIFVFLLIIAALSNENEIQTKNPIITTGAAIVGSIKETNLVENLIDKSEEFIDEITS
jgi:hypothetical protein